MSIFLGNGTSETSVNKPLDGYFFSEYKLLRALRRVMGEAAVVAVVDSPKISLKSLRVEPGFLL